MVARVGFLPLPENRLLAEPIQQGLDLLHVLIAQSILLAFLLHLLYLPGLYLLVQQLVLLQDFQNYSVVFQG